MPGRVKFLLPLLALLVSACSTYSHTHSYPPRGYSYQPGPAYYQQYPPNYVYYGSYQPGWSINVGMGGGYYGGGYYSNSSYGSPYGWGAPYWPTYSYGYYRPSYYYAYPYYDPWYYSYSGYYSGYGRGHYGHGYGSPYGSGYGHSNRPYYGGSHGYRPPGQQPITQQPPDRVVIPRDQRGRRGDVAEHPHQRYNEPRDRRSTTVVSEQEGLTRSVTVAPGSSGDQGMVVTSSSERKVQPNRLHPVAIQPDGSVGTVTAREKTYGRNPGRSEQPIQPLTRISTVSGQESPQPGRMSRQGRDMDTERNTQRSSGYTPPGHASQAINPDAAGRQQYAVPTRQAPAFTQQPEAPRSQPSYQQNLDSSSVAPREERQPQRDDSHTRDDQNR